MYLLLTRGDRENAITRISTENCLNETRVAGHFNNLIDDLRFQVRTIELAKAFFSGVAAAVNQKLDFFARSDARKLLSDLSAERITRVINYGPAKDPY
jgi:hypothetical protein